jgi:ATP-binding protein involved in chromosome partitioning
MRQASGTPGRRCPRIPDHGLVDEATVRATLSTLTESDGTPLLATSDVADVLVEEGWVAVVLSKARLPREVLGRVHRHLRNAFPNAEVELRAEPGITYRGGAGFGEGRHVVVVLGGKGGVGKSTIAVNLSLTLSAMGLAVGLLDGDVNGPDIPHLLGVHARERRRAAEWRMAQIRPPQRRQRPFERFGVEVMSVGFVVPERAPLALTERWLVSGLLRNLVFDVGWTADVLVIDAPPGTGEELQVMVRELPLSGALFVTTPQDLAQMDAARTLGLLEQHGVPVVGLVQNMASLTCPHCEQPIDLFAQSPRLEEAGVRILGRIPFDTRLSVTADKGVPLVLGDPRGPIASEFARIGSAVRRWLVERDGGSGLAESVNE